jgi:hypothetical protein
MQLLVAVVSGSAALVLIAASGLMNYVFMTSLGKSDFEEQILGAVSIAVSVFLALLPTLLSWAWRERRTLVLLIGVPMFFAFGAFSLCSALGFSARNRGSLSEDRALATQRLTGVRGEIADIDSKLKAAGSLPPEAVIADSLRGLEQDRRWRSTKACREATAEASITFCKDYFALRAKAESAGEAGRLEQRLNELKGEARALEDKGAGREADNQAAVLARFLGLPVARVERGLTVFLACLVEAGAALGLFLATGYRQQAAPEIAGGSRAITIIEGEAREVAPAAPRRGGAKPIAKMSPRRVPRLSQSSMGIRD